MSNCKTDVCARELNHARSPCAHLNLWKTMNCGCENECARTVQVNIFFCDYREFVECFIHFSLTVRLSNAVVFRISMFVVRINMNLFNRASSVEFVQATPIDPKPTAPSLN